MMTQAVPQEKTTQKWFSIDIFIFTQVSDLGMKFFYVIISISNSKSET